MRFDAVAFDLDGTLTDLMRAKRIATESAAYAMVDAGFEAAPQVAARRLFASYRKTGIDADFAFERFLRQETGRLDPAILEAGIEAYLRVKSALLAPYPRTIPTLCALSERGLRLALVTDAPARKALSRLDALGLRSYFEIVVTGDDTPTGKADSRPFETLLSRLSIPANRVLMVGDNPQRDVASARRAGLGTALAAYGRFPVARKRSPDEAPDFVLWRIDDVLRVVDSKVAIAS